MGIAIAGGTVEPHSKGFVAHVDSLEHSPDEAPALNSAEAQTLATGIAKEIQKALEYKFLGVGFFYRADQGSFLYHVNLGSEYHIAEGKLSDEMLSAISEVLSHTSGH